ncbi:MAG: hypothetical protein JWO31_3057 [Phycisphaerales bacterium]|nr:hypothetical protein [Phycisphaerales bacterium]
MFGSLFTSRTQENRSTARPAAFEALEGRQLMSAAVPAFDPAADAGDTVAAAVSLGVADKAKFAPAQTIGSTTDAADYYSFTVTANTAITVKLKAGGKPAKQVLPALSLTNPAGQAGVAAGKKSGKQILGPGTYYVGVTGTPAAGTSGVAYKLSIATKPSPKKGPTFTDPTNSGGTGGGTTTGGDGTGGNTGGGSTGAGSNGGTYTGTLSAATGQASTQSVVQYEFTATTAGTYQLPGDLTDDTSWSCVPYNPDGTAQTSGGGGLGDEDGKLAVTTVAGQKYVFNILYFGQASAPYSVTFDASFSGVRLATTQNV